jgi:hypothetical protein
MNKILYWRVSCKFLERAVEVRLIGEAMIIRKVRKLVK